MCWIFEALLISKTAMIGGKKILIELNNQLFYSSFTNMNQTILSQFLQYLSSDIKSLLCLLSSCKSYHKLQNNKFWKELTHSRYPFEIHQDSEEWMIYFINKYLVDQKFQTKSFKLKVFENHSSPISTFSLINLELPLYTKLTMISGDRKGHLMHWDLNSPQYDSFMKPLRELHENTIVSIEKVPNMSNIVLTCDGSNDYQDSKVQFWNLNSGKILFTYTMNLEVFPLISCKFLDEKTLVFAINNQLHYYEFDISTYKMKNIKIIDDAHENQITHMEYVPFKNLLVTISQNCQLKIWNYQKQESEVTIDAQITCISFAKDEFVIGTSYGKIYVLNYQGKVLKEVEAHFKAINCIKISQNGKRIISGSNDKTVKIFDQYKLVKTLEDHSAKVSALDFDSTKIITGGFDNCVFLYDSFTFEKKISNDSFLNAITKISLDESGQYAICASLDFTLKMFDFSLAKKWPFNKEDESLYDRDTQTYMKPPTKSWFDIKNELKKEITKENILGESGAFILRNVLSPEECEFYIKETEKIGYEDCHGYHPKYRSNKRIIICDENLAEIVYERVKKFLPEEYEYNDQNWTIQGMNERFRWCRYFPGQHFGAHFDGFFQRNKDERSFYTFMIYLNGDFEGGATNFLDESSKKITHKVQPEAGLTLLFPHQMFHEGEVLKTDKKYICRSDIMYKRDLN